MINLLLWAIVGSVTCCYASSIIGGQRGWMKNSVSVIAGAITGEFVMLVMNTIIGADLTAFDFYSFTVAIIGSVIMLYILQYICDNNGTSPGRRQYLPQYAYSKEQETYDIHI